MTGPPPGIERIIKSQSLDKTECPTCGRYVGPLEICPYCRAVHRKRPIIFWVKYLTPILGIAGLLLLHQLGHSMGNPLVKIADLDRTSNFAYVKLEGSVCGEPRFYHAAGSNDPTAGTMEFCLDDGSGRTRIKTYEDATRRIVRQKKVPSRGDTVRVTGNYQVRTYKHSLIVGSPAEIEIKPAPVVANLSAEELAWAPADAWPAESRVTVTGTVAYVWNDREKGKYTAVIHLGGGDRRDDRGKRRSVRVEVTWTRLEMEGAIPVGAPRWEGIPAKGATVTVTGAVRYVERGKRPGWRLYPGWGSDVQVVATPEGGGDDV